MLGQTADSEAQSSKASDLAQTLDRHFPNLQHWRAGSDPNPTEAIEQQCGQCMTLTQGSQLDLKAQRAYRSAAPCSSGFCSHARQQNGEEKWTGHACVLHECIHEY